MVPGLALAPVAALLLIAPPVVAAPRTHVVVIDKLKFGPPPSDVKVGDTIIWQNKDLFRHTATAANGAFNIDMPAGASGKAVVRKAGTIPYTCKFHPGMRSVIKVVK